jgi:SAM-dependent methyltransferase
MSAAVSVRCAPTSRISSVRQGTVVGIDASEKLIGGARELWSALPIRFDVGDAEALAFDDATFDAVRADRLVQHLNRPATAIAEMARVVRRDGRVLGGDTVHDAAAVATAHPRVWEVIRAHGSGANRQPRAGLHLSEWMQGAGLVVEVKVLAGVMSDWQLFRTLYRVEEAVVLAVESGAIPARDAANFTAEQDERSDRGVFAASVFFVQAVSTKLS